MAPPLAATACSNKSVVLVVVVPLLLMALLAASAAAEGRSVGLQFQQQADGQYCGRVRVCKEDLCSAACTVVGIAGVGQCKVVGGVPTCCCGVPTKPPASVVGVQQPTSLRIDPSLD